MLERKKLSNGLIGLLAEPAKKPVMELHPNRPRQLKIWKDQLSLLLFLPERNNIAVVLIVLFVTTISVSLKFEPNGTYL